MAHDGHRTAALNMTPHPLQKTLPLVLSLPATSPGLRNRCFE
jgi:hypothetical protein